MTDAQMGPVGIAVPSASWGRGWRDIVPVTTPLAGAAAVHLIPSRTAEAVLTAVATYTLSAAVANRFPSLSFRNGDGAVFAVFAASTAVVASAVATFTWALGCNIPAGAAGAAPVVPLPDFILDPGWSIVIGAVGLDVADQISGVSLAVNHIPTGPTGPPQRTAPLGATAGAYGGGVDLNVSITG